MNPRNPPTARRSTPKPRRASLPDRTLEPGERARWVAAQAPADGWPSASANAELTRLRTQALEEPAGLFNALHAVHFRALEALAPHTQRGYASDWRGFVAFCRNAGFIALPASPPAIEAFIEFSLPRASGIPYKYLTAEAPRRDGKVSTLQRALAAIRAVHDWLQYPNPCAHADVVHTLRINTRGRSAKTPKNALRYAVIERALLTYGYTLPDLRVKALVTVAFSTLLRRSELVALQVSDFRPTPGAKDGTMYLRNSKTDQAGHGAERYVSAEARAHLEAWLDAAGITEGPIFVRLNCKGRPLRKALDPSWVAIFFKEVAERAGYKKHEIPYIAGHSTRIGATHALAEGGADVLQVQQDGGWKSPQMPALYLRGQKARSGGMAQWFRARTVRSVKRQSRARRRSDSDRGGG